MFSTPFTTSSRGMMTDSITAWASAPLYVALMVTMGGAMSGYCSTGRVCRLTTPMTTVSTAMAKAATQCFTKKCVFFCSTTYFTFTPFDKFCTPLMTISSPLCRPLFT